MANLTRGESNWSSGTLTQTAQSKTYTLSTANKYVDKNIALTIKAQDGAAAVKGDQSISTSGSITRNGGTLTATLSGSKSIAGTVSKAGWISSVSSATVSASGTATAKATDLDSNLAAGNIKKDTTVFGVTGTLDYVKTVSSVPTTKDTSIIYNSTNGKYYLWK